MTKNVSKFSFIVMITLLLAFALSGTSFASIVTWSQPVDTSANVYDVDSYSDNSGTFVQLAADDWECIDGTQDITGINWWGSYSEYYGSAPQFSTSIVDFTIDIYSDGGTQPGGTYTEMGTYTISNIEETYCDLSKGTRESVFKYRVNFDNTFNQSEKVTYWIAIMATLNSSPAYDWGWSTTNPANNWGDPAVTTSDFANWVPQSYPTGHFYQGQDVNMAFELLSAGEEVPEPATMMLLGSLATGLFGFAGLRKRFSKR